MPSSEPPEYVTVREVAAQFRVSKMTVYRMIESGELPAIRFGGSLRIRAEVVRKITAQAPTSP